VGVWTMKHRDFVGGRREASVTGVDRIKPGGQAEEVRGHGGELPRAKQL
jgi:hypothetical protein